MNACLALCKLHMVVWPTLCVCVCKSTCIILYTVLLRTLYTFCNGIHLILYITVLEISFQMPCSSPAVKIWINLRCLELRRSCLCFKERYQMSKTKGGHGPDPNLHTCALRGPVVECWSLFISLCRLCSWELPTIHSNLTLNTCQWKHGDVKIGKQRGHLCSAW